MYRVPSSSHRTSSGNCQCVGSQGLPDHGQCLSSTSQFHALCLDIIELIRVFSVFLTDFSLPIAIYLPILAQQCKVLIWNFNFSILPNHFVWALSIFPYGLYAQADGGRLTTVATWVLGIFGWDCWAISEAYCFLKHNSYFPVIIPSFSGLFGSTRFRVT